MKPTAPIFWLLFVLLISPELIAGQHPARNAPAASPVLGTMALARQLYNHLFPPHLVAEQDEGRVKAIASAISTWARTYSRFLPNRQPLQIAPVPQARAAEPEVRWGPPHHDQQQPPRMENDDAPAAAQKRENTYTQQVLNRQATFAGRQAQGLTPGHLKELFAMAGPESAKEIIKAIPNLAHLAARPAGPAPRHQQERARLAGVVQRIHASRDAAVEIFIDAILGEIETELANGGGTRESLQKMLGLLKNVPDNIAFHPVLRERFVAAFVRLAHRVGGPELMIRLVAEQHQAFQHKSFAPYRRVDGPNHANFINDLSSYWPIYCLFINAAARELEQIENPGERYEQLNNLGNAVFREGGAQLERYHESYLDFITALLSNPPVTQNRSSWQSIKDAFMGDFRSALIGAIRPTYWSIEAIRSANLRLIKALHENGLLVDYAPQGILDGPIADAAYNGRADIVDFLASIGFSLGRSVPLRWDKTPLQNAVLYGHHDAVRALLRAGVLVNEYEAGSWALVLAVLRNDVAMVKDLLEAGARVGIRTKEGKDARALAAEIKDAEKRAQILALLDGQDAPAAAQQESKKDK